MAVDSPGYPDILHLKRMPNLCFLAVEANGTCSACFGEHGGMFMTVGARNWWRDATASCPSRIKAEARSMCNSGRIEPQLTVVVPGTSKLLFLFLPSQSHSLCPLSGRDHLPGRSPALSLRLCFQGNPQKTHTQRARCSGSPSGSYCSQQLYEVQRLTSRNGRGRI